MKILVWGLHITAEPLEAGPDSLEPAQEKQQLTTTPEGESSRGGETRTRVPSAVLLALNSFKFKPHMLDQLSCTSVSPRLSEVSPLPVIGAMNFKGETPFIRIREFTTTSLVQEEHSLTILRTYPRRCAWLAPPRYRITAPPFRKTP